MGSDMGVNTTHFPLTPFCDCDNFHLDFAPHGQVSRLPPVDEVREVRTPMPEVDPAIVDASLWSDIGNWLHWLWAYFFCIVLIAFTFLTAHAVIPSLVDSGHLPARFLMLRRPMYAGVFALIGLAVLFMFWTVQNTILLEDLYNRFWI